MSIGNEENMEKVRGLMAKADQIKLGGELEASVPIDYESEYGNKYQGIIIFKHPTMKEYLKIGALKSEYFRQEGVTNLNLVDATVRFVAQVMATLSVVIVKCPEWLLKLEEIQEPDVLYHVFGKYEEWENSFRKSKKYDGAGDQAAGSNVPGNGESANGAEAVVS